MQQPVKKEGARQAFQTAGKNVFISIMRRLEPLKLCITIFKIVLPAGQKIRDKILSTNFTPNLS
jgi:hypothetical protein